MPKPLGVLTTHYLTNPVPLSESDPIHRVTNQYITSTYCELQVGVEHAIVSIWLVRETGSTTGTNHTHRWKCMACVGGWFMNHPHKPYVHFQRCVRSDLQSTQHLYTFRVGYGKMTTRTHARTHAHTHARTHVHTHLGHSLHCDTKQNKVKCLAEVHTSTTLWAMQATYIPFRRSAVSLAAFPNGNKTNELATTLAINFQLSVKGFAWAHVVCSIVLDSR
jgi:hypothetical protein